MSNYISKSFQDNIHLLTIEHIMKGAAGYAEYTLQYPLKNKAKCIDFSTKTVIFTNDSGISITDPGMDILTPLIFQNIKQKSTELVFSENKEQMDPDTFQIVATLFTNNFDLKNGAEGEKSEFYHTFVRHFCIGCQDY